MKYYSKFRGTEIKFVRYTRSDFRGDFVCPEHRIQWGLGSIISEVDLRWVSIFEELL